MKKLSFSFDVMKLSLTHSLTLDLAFFHNFSKSVKENTIKVFIAADLLIIRGIILRVLMDNGM